MQTSCPASRFKGGGEQVLTALEARGGAGGLSARQCTVDQINGAVLASSAARAAWYSCANRAVRSATLSTELIVPIPCPDPQISFHALASVLPPEPKFIFDGSLSGRLSGSSPALTIEDRR